jgi:hypothetical protein
MSSLQSSKDIYINVGKSICEYTQKAVYGPVDVFVLKTLPQEEEDTCGYYALHNTAIIVKAIESNKEGLEISLNNRDLMSNFCGQGEGAYGLYRDMVIRQREKEGYKVSEGKPLTIDEEMILIPAIEKDLSITHPIYLIQGVDNCLNVNIGEGFEPCCSLTQDSPLGLRLRESSRTNQEILLGFVVYSGAYRPNQGTCHWISLVMHRSPNNVVPTFYVSDSMSTNVDTFYLRKLVDRCTKLLIPSTDDLKIEEDFFPLEDHRVPQHKELFSPPQFKQDGRLIHGVVGTILCVGSYIAYKRYKNRKQADEDGDDCCEEYEMY